MKRFLGFVIQKLQQLQAMNKRISPHEYGKLRHQHRQPYIPTKSRHRDGASGALGSAIAGLGLILFSSVAHGQAVSLGQAGNFAIVSAAGVTNDGFSVVNGDVGLSPLTTIEGFTFSTPPGFGIVNGTVHYNDTIAMDARADAMTAYNTLAGMAYIPANDLTGQDLGGKTLTAGTYHFDTSAQLTGNLILDTGTDPNAVFVFQIGSTLTTATNASVTVIGAGAGLTPNIFWQVGSSATLNTGTDFTGNILALASVSMGTGTDLINGRALALNGAVTLLSNDITAPATVLAAPGRYWNGTNSRLWSEVNWSTTVDGLDQVALGTDVDVIFSVNNGPINQDTILDSDVTISSLTVNDVIPVTIGNPIGVTNTLTISASGLVTGININDGAGLTTINSNLELGYLSQIVTVNNVDGLVINGVISGTNGLVKAGTGILTLTGAETYTGATVVSEGILQLGDGVTTGTSIAFSDSVSVSPDGTLVFNLADGETFVNSVTNNGEIQWIADGTNIQAASSVFSGTGDMIVDAAGTAVILGNNTYTGSTVITDGTLQLGNGIATGSSIALSDAVSVALDGTLALNLADGETFVNSVTNNGEIQWIADGTNIQSESSVFSGTGDMIVDAAGTAVILGNNTYTGSTVITDGTLQLGDGIVLDASIATTDSVYIAPDGTLALNLADEEIFGNSVINDGLIQWIADGTNYQAPASVFSGAGEMLITASGTTVLMGDNTFSGGTTVDTTGDVLVGNQFSNTSSPFGTGVLTIDNGTIDTVNSQLLQIEVGGYDQSGGEIAMHLEGTNPGDYTRYLVDGTAQLSGGTVFVYDLSGNYVPQGGDEQNIINTTGGLTGEFASNLPDARFYNAVYDVDVFYAQGGTLLYPTITYDANNANVTWVQDAFRSVPGLTPNQDAVGGGLDGFLEANPGIPLDVITFLNIQDINDLPAMYDLIAPDELTAIYKMGFAASEIQNANIQRHLERVRNGSTRPVQQTYTTPDEKGGKGGMVQETVMTQQNSQWSVFIEGTGGSASVDADGNASGYDFDTTGVTVGADKRVSDNLAIGVLGGYGKSDASLINGGRIDAESFRGAVYMTAFNDGFFVDALLGAGYNTYDTRRASLLGFAEGSPEGWDLNAMINTGYDIRSGNWTFTPTASLAYTRVMLDSFTETGSLSPLSYPDQHQDSLRSEIGARIAYRAMFGSVAVIPQVRIAWQHEFMDSTQSMDANFVGGSGPTFTVNGPHMDRDRALLSAGISAQLTPTVSIYGFYDGELGSSSNYSSNQISAGIKIDF